jgi:hypothetical protein
LCPIATLAKLKNRTERFPIKNIVVKKRGEGLFGPHTHSVLNNYLLKHPEKLPSDKIINWCKNK